MREVEYRGMNVQSICEMLPSYFTADLSYVQGGERICQEMISKMNQLPCKGTSFPSGTQTLPVYDRTGMGAQKNFTEQLWVDLQDQNRHAFMDTHSLPHGECFQKYIYEAAAKCQVGVFVLSEEFFSKSIWPMHELQTFLQKNSGENHRLLPLFFGISPDNLKDPENERRWVRIWEEWSTKDKRVDVSFWRYAIRVLKSHNGVVFQQGMREVEYRRMIVQSICEFVPPYFTADLSYVQGGERIRQELMNKMNQLRCKGTRLPSGTQILPVYGRAGMGKTTLCKIMCNYFQRRCRVCYIQVGANGLDHLSQQKIVLRQLTGASESLLQDLTDTNVAQNLLIRRIDKQRVFLAIDGACTEESSVGIIRRLLSLPFTKESLVLVTACTSEDLQEVIGYNRCGSCFHLPNINEEEAIHILLERAIPNCNFESLSDSEQHIIRYCTSLCQISCTIQTNSKNWQGVMTEYYYHPPSLIKMGAQLGSDLSKWKHKLECPQFFFQS